MRRFAALFPVLLMLGCESMPPHRVIKFDSEPQGARVFIGMGPNEKDAEKARNYLGTTPLEWSVQEHLMDGDGEYFEPRGAFVYSMFVPRAVVFFADPPSGHTNLFPKRQVFHAETEFRPGDRIPVGIFFDLTKP